MMRITERATLRAVFWYNPSVYSGLQHMAHMGRGNRVIVVASILLAGILLIIGAGYYIHVQRQNTVAPSPATQPATAPVTQPTLSLTSTASSEPEPPQTYMDLLKLHFGRLPTTRPLTTQLELDEGARVILEEPIYLCPSGQLWITRSDAPPTNVVLARFTRPGPRQFAHLVRENVVYVHWTVEGGVWTPHLVCRKSDGSLELVERSNRRSLALEREYRWDRAFSWNEHVVVSDDRGVGILTIGNSITEVYCDLLEAAPETQNANAPQMLLDTRGLLAWIPWENGRPGSVGAARFVDGQWHRLGPEQGWPEKILHLVPLLDGSVLQLVAGEDDQVTLTMSTLDLATIDATEVRRLIAELSDLDADKRREAHEKLQQYGPGVWPILEEALKTSRGEARIRLNQILAGKNQPTLGNMSLNDGKLRTHARYRDGAALFYAPGGVTIPDGERSPIVTIPAWIIFRPGWPIQLAPKALHGELNADRIRVICDPRSGEWIVTDDVYGPRRVVANELVPLLRKRERTFSRFAGIDVQGRWLFRRDAEDGAPAGTLILDPFLPSLTPRLPGWEMVIDDGSVGWDKHDWPVIKSGGAWALHERGWQPLNEEENPMLTEVAKVNPAQQSPAPPEDHATTTSSDDAAADDGASAASQPAPSEPPLLVDSDGNRYFDGTDVLRRVSPDGRQVVWPLPFSAAGSGPVTLVQADGRLFLFNYPGRVLRIGRGDSDDEPFVVEATFTRLIPAEEVRRIWTDPAERICIVHGENRLVVLFPAGHIPRDIAVMMPPEALRAALEDE